MKNLNLFVAYQQEFAKIAAALAKNETLPPGPTPPDLRHCTVWQRSKQTKKSTNKHFEITTL
jgi:hypothetical protein